jgi:hypothetical protein
LRKKRRNLSHHDVLISFSSAMNVFSGELFCFCGNSLLGFVGERDKEEIYHGMFISFSCAGDVF